MGAQVTVESERRNPWPGDERDSDSSECWTSSPPDELPQVWNVLRGEMSFVGPRPERAHFVRQFERLIPGYADRFAVLPGIAGLGQLCSGYDTSLRTVRRKTRYDRLYVRRGGTALDAALVVATFVYVAVPRGRRHAHGAWPVSVLPPPSFPAIHRWRLVPIVAKLLLASPQPKALGGATQPPATHVEKLPT
ncbi:MAG TPA: sugar transferase [Candidatus Krumholzibacteria bacterium]|nr:sugar transferase [Candidatus Krumholzibacteria bacterium]